MVEKVTLSHVMREIGITRITPFACDGSRAPGDACALGAAGRWLGVCPYPFPAVDDFIRLYSDNRLGEDSKEFHLASEIVRINDDGLTQDAITFAFLFFCNIKLDFDEYVRISDKEILLVEDEQEDSYEA